MTELRGEVIVHDGVWLYWSRDGLPCIFLRFFSEPDKTGVQRSREYRLHHEEAVRLARVLCEALDCSISNVIEFLQRREGQREDLHAYVEAREHILEAKRRLEQALEVLSGVNLRW